MTYGVRGRQSLVSRLSATAAAEKCNNNIDEWAALDEFQGGIGTSTAVLGKGGRTPGS